MQLERDCRVEQREREQREERVQLRRREWRQVQPEQRVQPQSPVLGMGSLSRGFRETGSFPCERTVRMSDVRVGSAARIESRLSFATARQRPSAWCLLVQHFWS